MFNYIYVCTHLCMYICMYVIADSVAFSSCHCPATRVIQSYLVNKGAQWDIMEQNTAAYMYLYSLYLSYR